MSGTARTARQFELVAALLLATATVATAWSAYQSRQWTGEQALNTSKATADRIAENRYAALADRQVQIDLATPVARRPAHHVTGRSAHPIRVMSRRADARTIAAMTHVADDMNADRRHDFTFGRAMGWFIFLSSMFWPRVFILAWWIFSNLLGRAYSTALIPTVGFFVLPWTTLVYAMCWGRSSDRVFGWEWVLVALAFAIDIATYAGGRSLRR